MSAVGRVSLVCRCGNRDDIDVTLPPCSNDCGAVMQVAPPFTRAELGLLFSLITTDVTDEETRGGTTYEIVTTGEKATAMQLLDKVGQMILQGARI